MVREAELFFEWLIANNQNGVEWVALQSAAWPVGFADGALRISRWRNLTDMAHGFGLSVGLDVPIALQQQHSWYMVDASDTTATLASQLDAISHRLDLLFEENAAGASFDFLNTESGTTEFSHPDCGRMLAWMNHTAAYASTRYQKRVYIKVHVSHGQTCSDYLDEHGQPINFNFLPQFALPELAVAPHTVQTYAFDDPSAGTYGNTNFSFMLDWASAQMRSGRRTIYYGETAYWVCNHYIYNCNIPRATHNIRHAARMQSGCKAHDLLRRVLRRTRCVASV